MGNCIQSSSKSTVIENLIENGNSSPKAKNEISPPRFDQTVQKVKVTETAIPSSIANDDFQIPIKVFAPSIPRAAVFFIHGGIFVQGDRNSHPTISNALASQLGLVVVTATFRNGKEAPHKTNITQQDLKDVVNYMKQQQQWKNLPIGLVGSSSGGFFALQLAQSLGHDTIKFCIPICPVADPFKRASYLRSSIRGSAKSEGYNAVHDSNKSQEILDKQLSYWGDDSSMMEAGNSVSKRNVFADDDDEKSKDKNTHDIPTLLIIGSADKNVPFAVTSDVQAWATRTVVIGGRGHELCDKIVEGGGYHCYLGDIDRFIDYSLSLPEIPQLKSFEA